MMTRVAVVAALAGCQHDLTIGGSSGVLFGASIDAPLDTTASQESAFTAAETQTGRRFDLHRIYHSWHNAVPDELEQWTVANGRTPIISFKSDPSLPWAELAAGAGDAQLAAMAAGYAALAAPVFAIFDQSPENSDQGTPAEFAAAYRHIVETFRAAGVTNVEWIFNLKSVSFPDRADDFYPGDDVIDWNGVAVYNYGVNDGGRWVSFADLMTDFVTWATPHAKPLIVSEWASEEDASRPGRKAAWIEDTETAIHAWPDVRAMSAQWTQDPSFKLDSTPSSFGAFQTFAADPYTHLRDSQ